MQQWIDRMNHMYYKQNQRNKGILYLILGGFLFFLCAGKLVFQLVGVLLSLVLIHIGLAQLGQPSLLITIQRWLDTIRYRFFR